MCVCWQAESSSCDGDAAAAALPVPASKGGSPSRLAVVRVCISRPFLTLICVYAWLHPSASLYVDSLVLGLLGTLLHAPPQIPATPLPPKKRRGVATASDTPAAASAATDVFPLGSTTASVLQGACAIRGFALSRHAHAHTSALSRHAHVISLSLSLFFSRFPSLFLYLFLSLSLSRSLSPSPSPPLSLPPPHTRTHSAANAVGFKVLETRGSAPSPRWGHAAFMVEGANKMVVYGVSLSLPLLPSSLPLFPFLSRSPSVPIAFL